MPAHFSDGHVVILAGDSEAVAALACREVSEGLPDGVPQVGNSAGRRGSKQVLQLGEDLLN